MKIRYGDGICNIHSQVGIQDGRAVDAKRQIGLVGGQVANLENSRLPGLNKKGHLVPDFCRHCSPCGFDTVLHNAGGEITECMRSNVAMLLPGVGSALELLEDRLAEAAVRLDDLPRVQGWAFLNSLRGLIGAELVP